MCLFTHSTTHSKLKETAHYTMHTVWLEGRDSMDGG